MQGDKRRVKRRVSIRGSRWSTDMVWSFALALVLVLTGCAAPSARTGGASFGGAAPSASVSGSSGTPSSAAATLAAASTVYSGYLAAMDAVSTDGGVQPERVTPFVTADLDLSVAVAFQSMRSEKIRTMGSTRITALTLVAYHAGPRRTTVTLAACLDISSARVLDAVGADVTPANRADHRNYRVILIAGAEGAARLRVAEARPTPPDATCP